MATINKEAYVAAAPDQVWNRLRDIRWPADLSALIDTVEVTSDNTRVCTTANGADVTETIISVDDERRRTAYTVTDSPFGLAHHNASLQVFADGDGSRIVWLVDVLPDEAGAGLEPVIEDELKTIVTRLETGN